MKEISYYHLLDVAKMLTNQKITIEMLQTPDYLPREFGKVIISSVEIIPEMITPPYKRVKLIFGTSKKNYGFLDYTTSRTEWHTLRIGFNGLTWSDNSVCSKSLVRSTMRNYRY